MISGSSRLGRAAALLIFLGCTEKTAAPPAAELGRFEVESGRLVVIDPCYSREDFKELGAIVPKARVGTWVASVRAVDSKEWGRRCAELIVRHESRPAVENVGWSRRPGLISVDSGQAGVFDEKHFRKQEDVPKDHVWKEKPIDPDDRWYSICCERTLGSAQAGTIPFGAVSSSGIGDGAYEWDLLVDEKGEGVAVRIVFLKDGDR